MARGNNKQTIFHHESDYKQFLKIIEFLQTECDFKLHAFCLMPNHYHFLMETGSVNLAAIMKRLNEKYTHYYHRKYHFVGHVFQGRYKAFNVKSDCYFLQTSRYIHMNPVAAGMVSTPDEYRWSSYRLFFGINASPFVSTEKTLAYFDKKTSGPLSYHRFVTAPKLSGLDAVIQRDITDFEDVESPCMRCLTG